MENISDHCRSALPASKPYDNFSSSISPRWFLGVPVAEVPSPPEIEVVRPFSSTAVVEFAEPASTGGVPVLRYKVEWRLPSSADWTSAEYKLGDGEWISGKKVPLCCNGVSRLPRSP